jgi:hypothetical protein
MSHLMPPEQQAKFHSALKAGGWQGVWETLQPGQVNLTLLLCHLCPACSVTLRMTPCS